MRSRIVSIPLPGFRAMTCGAMSTGTSIRGPITAANASWEAMPKTPTATAMASSKLLLAAVKEKSSCILVVHTQLVGHEEADEKHQQEINNQRHGHPHHIQGKLHNVVSLQENMTTMVKSRATRVMGEILGMN